MTNCEEINSALEAFVDDELSPVAASRVAAHVETCPSCKSVLEEMGTLRSALHEWSDQRPSPGLDFRVMQSFRAALASPKPSPRRVILFGGLLGGTMRIPRALMPAVLTAALIAVAVAYNLGRVGGATPPLVSPAFGSMPAPTIVEVAVVHDHITRVHTPYRSWPPKVDRGGAATRSAPEDLPPVIGPDRMNSLADFEPIKGATARVIEGGR